MDGHARPPWLDRLGRPAPMPTALRLNQLLCRRHGAGFDYCPGMFFFLRRVPVLLGLLVCGALAIFVSARFETSTDMSVFFPEGEQRTKAQVSKALSTSELSRTLVVTLEGRSASEGAALAEELESLIRSDSTLVAALTYVNSGPPQGIDEALWRLYNPRRLYFLSDTPEKAAQRLTDDGLSQTLQNLAESLASPVSPLINRVAPEDPFLIVPNLLQSLMSGGPSLALEDGRYVAQDRFGVVFLATKAPALDSTVQADVWRRLTLAFESLRRSHPEVRIETSGFARFAQSTHEHMEQDISRIAIISIVSLTLFCWFLFRSLRLLILLQVPIALGMLAAMATTLAFWGNVHGVTLAVGASLIGVAMDYVLHFYAHLRLCPAPGGPVATMRHIKVALLLGALTTVVGFVALGASPFPALVQIATFSAVGVSAALVATLTIVPHLVRANQAPGPHLERLAAALARLVSVLYRQPLVARGLLAGAALFSVVGIWRLDWQDDLSTLTLPDRAIAAEDARVRQRITSLDTRRVVVALAETEDQALEVNAQVAAALDRAQATGNLAGWQGLSRMLPSPEVQRQVYEAVRTADLPHRMPEALERAGFNADGFAPFYELLRAPPPEPLTFDTILSSPAADLVRPHRVLLGDGSVALLTFLRGVKDSGPIEHDLASIPGALYIDQNELMTNASRQHRRRTSELVMAGLVGVFLVLLAQYRRWRPALAATLPAVLAASVTLGVLGLIGVPLNILGLTSLLMVLSLGVDYSVFLVDADNGVDLISEQELGATMTGLLVSWISNLCGFGLLAMSEQPALRLIGLIAGIGVTCALLLAPTALVPTARSRRTRPDQSERSVIQTW